MQNCAAKHLMYNFHTQTRS